MPPSNLDPQWYDDEFKKRQDQLDRILQHRDRLAHEEEVRRVRERDAQIAHQRTTLEAYYDQINRRAGWRMPLAVTATGVHATDEGLVLEVADGKVKVPNELLTSILTLVQMLQLAKLAPSADP